MAIATPDINAPGNNPTMAYAPNNIPTINGVFNTSIAGNVISANDASVDILIHL
jgi:hypothetical protein